MKYLITGILGLSLLFTTGCSTIATTWDSGKRLVTNVVDNTIVGASEIIGAVAEDVVDGAAIVADTAAGSVEALSDYVDSETDILQEEDQEDSPNE
jgi:hypothetical protein